MKSALYSLILAIMLAPAASAQSNMSCTRPYEGKTVCKFDDGRVNVTESFADGAYFSTWYTAREWQRHLWVEAHPKVRRDPGTCSGPWTTKAHCESYGFVWTPKAAK